MAGGTVTDFCTFWKYNNILCLAGNSRKSAPILEITQTTSGHRQTASPQPNCANFELVSRCILVDLKNLKWTNLYPKYPWFKENFSLKTGEIFEVLDDDLSGHFKIRTIAGQIGFISPTNFRCAFSLSKTGWFLPRVSRRAASEMLNEENRPIGSFLVRKPVWKSRKFDWIILITVVLSYHTNTLPIDRSFTDKPSWYYNTVPNNSL